VVIVMRDFREHWGLPTKAVKLCPTCYTEHKGKCHFMRGQQREKAKAKVEELERWKADKKRRKSLIHVHRLIRELCDAVEAGRRAARPTSWFGRKPNPKSRLAVGTDQGKAKRNTLTRKRTDEDRST
jgi:hypothetical protein